jgi:hypothetical protein
MNTQNIPLLNASVLDALDNGTQDGINKVAQVAADYTRTQIREDSFAFKILPPEKIDNSRLKRDLTENLGVIENLEPDSPGAKWVPLETVPDGEYITGSRYLIPFARVLTRKMTKDIDELRTYDYDIRKILTDNSIKDGLAKIDEKFIETVNSIVFNAEAAGKENKVTGKVQWVDFKDGLNRETWTEASKMLPRPNKEGKFVTRNYIALMNDVTARDILKLDRNATGGDLAQKNWIEGLTTDTIEGIKLVTTIKSTIVPENYVYFFAEPSFLGHCYYLTDWTMDLKKEGFFIQFYSYWLGGFGFGNVAGMALARFNQTDGI